MKLNQVIAQEKTLKGTVNAAVDAIYKALQKPSLFEGFTKAYRAYREEDGAQEQVPGQAQNIQLQASTLLTQLAQEWTKLYDVTAQKDYANCNATADVEVEGQVVLKAVPITFLLFLEKQLTDLHTMLAKAPVLDAAEKWDLDQNTGVYRTQPTLVQRTKKVQKPIVLYPATTEHPAQTQLITEDVAVGNWETTRYSGALPHQRVRQLLARVDALRASVKIAREEANMAPAPAVEAGKKIFDYLFGAA